MLLANSALAFWKAIFLAVAKSGDFPTCFALKAFSSVRYSLELNGTEISTAPVSFCTVFFLDLQPTRVKTAIAGIKSKFDVFIFYGFFVYVMIDFKTRSKFIKISEINVC